MQNHIMIDLETLATGDLPMITSIGWCIFNKDRISGSGVMYPELEGNMDIDTVLWWLKQSTEAQSKIADVQRLISLEECLMRLGSFIEESEVTGVWAMGVSFDLRILREWYRQFGHNTPWKYYSERCMRSFRELGVERIKSEIPHCAKEDAIAQAKTVQKVWSKND